MQDKFLIATKVKKTIIYMEKMLENYPHTENVLRNKIIDKAYNLLENTYKANIYKEINYMKEILVDIKMLEFYIKKSLDKKIINFKKYEVIGNHFLELNKMISAWIVYEKKKTNI